MGASGWEYTVPYQEDLGQALAELRRTVLATRDYVWIGEDAGLPWPDTERELWENEDAQQCGTHSVLDIHALGTAHADPEYGALRPVGREEAVRLFGTATPTRTDVPDSADLPCERGEGRSLVLHDAAGTPQELYFWGATGD